MTGACAAWLADPGHGLNEVRIVLFDRRSDRAFEDALDAIPGPP